MFLPFSNLPSRLWDTHAFLNFPLISPSAGPMIWQMIWTPAHQYFGSSVKHLPKITQLIHRKIRNQALTPTSL